MASVGDVLREKACNFARFLEGVIGDQMNNELREYVFTVKNLQAEQFAAWVLETCVPHAQNVDALIDGLARQWKIDLSRVTADDRCKFRRYILFFITVVSGPS